MAPFHDKPALFHSSDRNRKYPHISLKFVSSGTNLEVTAQDPWLTFLALGSLHVKA